MTANEVLNRALTLLGYTDKNGNEQLTRRIMNKAVAIINTVYEDLWRIIEENPSTAGAVPLPLGKGGNQNTADVVSYEFQPIVSLSDEIKLKDRALEALPYGTAAFLAQGENDGDQQQLWISVYNKKRAGLTRLTRIKDNVPRCCDL